MVSVLFAKLRYLDIRFFLQKCYCSNVVLFTNCRRQLENFRVSDEGFNNRFRYQNATFPHLDRVYPVLYPAKDNLDYTANDNWNNRRMNLQVDKFDTIKRVNGDFHVQVLKETPE